MASDGSKRSQVSSVPPRKLNVQKFAEARASEMESLHSIVSNRLDNNFRSRRNKRRRTSAYNNQITRKRSKKRRKFGATDKANALDDEKDQKKVPRRIRRSIELKKNPESGFPVSGDDTKRLRTHVWHAKRFTMRKLWGFYLPLGLQGRGRGSRALLKWVKEGVDSLLSILQMVLVPSPSSESGDSFHSVLSGAVYESAMLYHFGVPFSQPIAPVTYMWKPLDKQDREEDGNFNTSVGGNGSCETECHSHYRQLWLWIHASAFGEGFGALKLACQKQVNETGTLINCFSLEGQLAKLEVIGSKAFQLLQKILQPVNSTSKNSRQLKKCSMLEAQDDSQTKICSTLEDEEQISSCAILPLTVNDPRVFPDKRIEDVPESASTLTLNDELDHEMKKQVALLGISEKREELLSSSCSKFEGSGIVNDKSLWDASCGISPPMEENELCMEKHQTRMDYLCLDDPKSGKRKTSNEVQCLRSCPVLLLRNNDKRGSLMGVFWISIVSKGVRAIGLREKHWIACNIGSPYFPSDFPDCNAYSCSMGIEAAAADEKAELRPANIRHLRIPIPPPWNIVGVSLKNVATGEQYTEISSAKNMVDDKSSSHAGCGRRDMASLVCQGNPFDRIVARTSSMLTYFMNEIHGDHLLLFPHVASQKMSFVELMKKQSNLDHSQNMIKQINYNQKLCFLRVLLHAYKNGVFEEGAVVCVPQLTDISLWTSSSGINEIQLQMPQSSVRSYFKELSSGNWELQIPEDPASRASHRWPIGFVTTGFVRGSKKPVAQAFCEAVLLALLREEQWNEMPEKQRRKEIYVLVRNLRSSAYRLALATIVLEQQEDDVNFL
ncbi:Ribonuclease Ps [Citrus sinensis]|uniref:Ribonuclease Ps n=1 Tax=Citrus sinensis TaxID=2711 RepID=A0ACB8MMK8_CITSI|nr:Ribonuclease Ps [Citrus sinensis]